MDQFKKLSGIIAEAEDRIKDLYQIHRKLNKLYFSGKLKTIDIKIVVTAYGKASGVYSPEMQSIGIFVRVFRPKYYYYGCSKFLEDILLHEMIHQNIEESEELKKIYLEESNNRKTDHNCKAWIGEIQRISKLIECKDFNVSRYIQKNVPKEFLPEGSKKKNVDIPEELINEALDYSNLKDSISSNNYLLWDEIKSFPHSVRLKGYYKKSPESNPLQ